MEQRFPWQPLIQKSAAPTPALLPQAPVRAPGVCLLLPQLGDPPHHPLRRPLRHVFVLDKEWSPEEIAFPKLTTIHLHDLPTLRQICEVKMVAPALETIRIRGCWGLQRLPSVEKKPTVEIEKDVWDALEWDGVEAGHHPDLFEAPIHSRYYKKKLPRVSVLRYSDRIL